MNDRRFSQQDQQILRQIMQHRRDVRGNRFLPEAVPEAVLQQILEAAQFAPSVGYSQPWRFVFVDHPNTRQQVKDIFEQENQKAAGQFGPRQSQYRALKLEGIDEAPVNIAVFYHQDSQPVLGQTSMASAGEYSVVCAIQNMWLMARALNVGMGWVSIIDPEAIGTLLQAPDNCKLVAYLCLGYVDEFYNEPELKTLGWKAPLPWEAMVFKNGFEQS